MTIWNWSQGIDLVDPQFRITLGEGDTPLVRARNVERETGCELYFKLEMTNPSGSYKDRFAAVAISHMLRAGQRRCIATSSGNTGAALAAYCAAANVRCEIAVVETAPAGKLQQMLAYGAKVYRVRGFGTDPEITRSVFHRLQELGALPEAAMQVSAFRYSPRGMSGVALLGHELIEQLPECDHVLCPAGGGGLAMAVAETYAGHDKHRTRVHCVQPQGNDTICSRLNEGSNVAQDVQCTSKISGLQVASVVDGDETIAACRKTGGRGILVSDDATYQAQKRLAELEGIFAEPAGAISLAAAIQQIETGVISPGEKVVCLITGSGFKDPNSVEAMNAARDCPVVDVSDIQ